MIGKPEGRSASAPHDEGLVTFLVRAPDGLMQRPAGVGVAAPPGGQGLRVAVVRPRMAQIGGSAAGCGIMPRPDLS